MRRPRPSYKKMYEALVAAMGECDSTPVVLRDGVSPTHQIIVVDAVETIYEVVYSGPYGDLKREPFDGEDTDRVTVVSIATTRRYDSTAVFPLGASLVPQESPVPNLEDNGSQSEDELTLNPKEIL